MLNVTLSCTIGIDSNILRLDLYLHVLAVLVIFLK